MNEKLAYRPEQAAELMNTSRDTIYRLLKTGQLRSFKIGQGRFISADALHEFIRKAEAEGETVVQLYGAQAKETNT